MKLKSRDDLIVRKTLADIKPPTPRELAELRRAMNGPIDTSEIPERTLPVRHPVVRAGDGRIAGKPPSAIREAILHELGRRKMTRYALWKRARAFCPTLPDSAVYEFLLGRRMIGVVYCEALFEALGLGVRRVRKSA
jgi:hypothetical protein